jgi:hypothetical protein
MRVCPMGPILPCRQGLPKRTFFVKDYSTPCPHVLRCARAGWGRSLFSTTQGSGRPERLVFDVLLTKGRTGSAPYTSHLFRVGPVAGRKTGYAP